MLDKYYKEWLKKQTFKNIDDEKLKFDLISELTYLSKMSVEEYTLYRKWTEIQEKYPSKNSNPFFTEKSYPNMYPEILQIKNNIWIPESPEDYLKLKPVILPTKNNTKLSKTWSILKMFASTMMNRGTIGRSLRFIVIDDITKKLLGIMCLSGDFLDLTPRDNYIGWSREIRTKKKMINHTAIGSTIIPTQPLGFSYVGGKLLALLIISKEIEDLWNKAYKDKLVGITTTSLYGSFSQYQNLKYWSKRGHTSGSIKFEPSKEIIIRIREWLRLKYPRKYWEWYHAVNERGLPLKRDHKQRSLSFTYSKMSIDKNLIQTNHQRGIYFCPLFTNTSDYCRMEIGEKELNRRFDNKLSILVDIWKEKYAKKRVKSLLKNNRYTTSSLFYDDMIMMSWSETKEKYLKEIGR